MKKEQLGKKDFLKGMNDLENAFDHKMPPKQVEVYFETLRSKIDVDAFSLSVKVILETEHRFPSIATILNHTRDSEKPAYLKGVR